MNAQIDGIDTASESPNERLRYFVYMQRMHVEALRTQALLIAQLNPDKAKEAASKYLDAVLPISAEALFLEGFKKEMAGRALSRMGAFKIGGVRRAAAGSDAHQAAEGFTGGTIDNDRPEANPRGSFVKRPR